jgi:hypothetical protein
LQGWCKECLKAFDNDENMSKGDNTENIMDKLIEILEALGLRVYE